MKNTFLLLFLIICFQPTFSEGYWKRLDSTVYPVSSFATDGKCMVSCGINQYKIGPNFKDYFSRSFITLSNDGGTTWREIFASESDSSAGILGNFYAINNLRIIDSNNITAWGFDYIKADYSYKFVTTDKGANWEMTPVLDDEGNKIYVQNFQMVTHDYGALYDGWNGVYAIEDSGKTIHKISGYDTSELIVGKVQRIDSMTFVLTGGQFSSHRSVMITTNYGASWTNNYLPDMSGPPYFFDSKRGYFAQIESDSLGDDYPERLYLTEDGGKTYRIVFENTNAREGYLNKIVFIDSLHGRLFGQRNFYYTSNGGQTWEKDSLVIDKWKIAGGDFHYINDTTMYFRETRAFVWKYYPGKYTSAGEVGYSNPELLLASPNPFTDQTEIKFYVEQAGAVTITVRNSMGESVATKEYYSQSGEQTFSLEGAALPAGLYFCDVAAAGKTYRAKAVLVR